MTEGIRKKPETETDESERGGNTEQWVSQYGLLASALLMIGGVVMALVMAYKKITTTVLWSIAVVMYWAGVALALKPLREGKARIQKQQEEIAIMLDQLDPLAKAQVVEDATEA